MYEDRLRHGKLTECNGSISRTPNPRQRTDPRACVATKLIVITNSAWRFERGEPESSPFPTYPLIRSRHFMDFSFLLLLYHIVTNSNDFNNIQTLQLSHQFLLE